MKRTKYIDALLYCLGSRRDHRIASSLETFTEQDWFKFIELSRAHRVAPILYKRLKSHECCKSVPGWVVRRLGSLYLLNAKKQWAFVDELFQVVTKLKGDGVAFIVLKGPHLAETIYRDWALRPMWDLDILVKEKEMYRARSSLLDMGYSPIENYNPPDYHLPPLLKKGLLPIEIHHDISSTKRLPFTADHEMLWQRASSVEIGGVEVLVLSIEDSLLHLSLHACKHDFRISLMHIFDIYEILRQYKDRINWKELVSRANLWNSKKVLYLTFEVVRELLGISAPEEVLVDLRPQDYSVELLNGAEARVFGLEYSVPPKVLNFLKTRGLWAKLKLSFGILFSREVVSAKYPIDRNPRLIGYYYILHLSTQMARCVRLGPKIFRMGKNGLIQPEQMARSIQEWLATA